MKSDNFREISEEIKRQYELILSTDTALDTKTGIILGFVILIIVQIITAQSFIASMTKNGISMLLFSFGFSSILLSGFLGFRAYLVRPYEYGPEIPDLITQYRKGEKRDYTQVISGAIYKATRYNFTISEKKATFIKEMFILLIIGLGIMIPAGLIGIAQ